MTRNKLDNRISILIENCVSTLHRSLFVIVGERGKDQIGILHGILSKASRKSTFDVLWCYKNELGFYMNKKERKKQMKKMRLESQNLNEEYCFENFVASTKIRNCHYKDTHKILGQTFGMLVLQDFEALTPNLMAQTIETVKGGGMIVILLQSMTSLQQLYTMTMDVHAKYKTEWHPDVGCRFNKRFVLSLHSCPNCLLVNDELEMLPFPSSGANIRSIAQKKKSVDDVEFLTEQVLSELKGSQDTPSTRKLIDLCKTCDQARAVLKFIDVVSSKNLRTTVTLTSARGRGKSAALGLAVAAAVDLVYYSNIFVSSPSPENLKTLFSFILKGFDVLDYKDKTDYEVIQSVNPEFNNAVVRINIFRNGWQKVQYIHPTDADKLGAAALVVIDEAAAIPLPHVKSLLGPYVVFMASTVNGYEGTGRSLSLKLIDQLRAQASSAGNTVQSEQASSAGNNKLNEVSIQPTCLSTGRSLHELTLSEPIRYQSGDSVEAWLNHLLCLDAVVIPRLLSGFPLPSKCQLYYINRDALFGYHKPCEEFLQEIVALLTASHYKNSPNDLQMLADAPAHHLFCLLTPFESSRKMLQQVLCVIQVCLEGNLSERSILHMKSHGRRPAGDLIPCNIFEEFLDENFPSLCGARIVRIATRPDCQKKGYGLRAVEILQHYYKGKIIPLDEIPGHVSNDTSEEESSALCEEKPQPRKALSHLLVQLTKRQPEILDYIGVAYGLTEQLLRFWKKNGFSPVCLGQKPNDITGEYSCIMLKALKNECSSSNWLSKYSAKFRENYISDLGFEFRKFPPSLALKVFKSISMKNVTKVLTKEELDVRMSAYSIQRLETYCKDLGDYHLIMDLVPMIAELYFLNRLGDMSLASAKTTILLCVGLQPKLFDQVSTEMGLELSQVLGLFNRTMCFLCDRLKRVVEEAVEKTLLKPQDINLEPLEQTLEQELAEAAKEIEVKQKEEAKRLQDMDFSRFAIKGSEEEWQKALAGDQKTLVSIKRIRKSNEEPISYKKTKMHHGKKSNFKKRKM